ncbi:Similar to Uncharacterized RING finger membrane protein C15C4.06c; acc. no. Q1MTR5 [Pyronema omphalodes CBS 100304]|uniref:Similar to Uncharacterized RING finger membrane protein C15C4.06c acc. no. Q1MTR5 n=1 Tax=Pyronema omphalodes (strain CBS 100304) TaxID=1076935 RepID=U4L1J7_PYROM|nr:Similar to Uncharacterized RING finger membrane protein C15C4.06c; acc. no. Q1MTR5 [Pyronema omphalodes CBS 100304]
MSAETLRASILIFPNPPTSPRFSEAATSNNTFGLSLSRPFITTLFTAGHNSGDSIAGVLHFPDLPSTSTCRNISTLPSTSLHDDLPKSNFTSVALFPVIGFAPWTPRCNKEWLDAARDDRSVLDGFVFYSTNHTSTIPRHDHPYWNGIKFRDYGFPIYGMRGREGQLLMNKYTEFAEQQSILPDINNATGRARVFLEFDTGRGARLPGLWLFLLIVLGVLVAAIVAISCSMHLLQWRRRRSLRNRVARGEVDLEQLGIKRLLVPRKILDKLPLKPYQTGGTIEQPACSICLEDFVPTTTTVRVLPCNHQYHPACIDGFLEQQSSLCPLCKASVLPKGYVPPHLTNATVRREREVRRQRRREMGGGRIHRAWTRMWKNIGWGRGREGMEGTELRPTITQTGRQRGFERPEPTPSEPGKFRKVMRFVFPGY